MGTAMMEKEPQDGRVSTPPVGRKKTKPFSRDGTDDRPKVLEIAPYHNKLLYQIRYRWIASFHLEPNRVREAFFLALKHAKLRRIRFHDMRRTFASWLIANGESLVYVKEQLGHHSIQINVDTYGHLIPGANRKAVNALDEPEWEKASGKPVSLAQSAICIGAENNA